MIKEKITENQKEFLSEMFADWTEKDRQTMKSASEILERHAVNGVRKNDRVGMQEVIFAMDFVTKMMERHNKILDSKEKGFADWY